MSEGGFVNYDDVHPEVGGLIKQGDQRRGVKPAKRKKAKRDAGRVRLYLDIPPGVRAELKRIAGEEDVSISSLAAFFLVEAMGRYGRGELPLDDYKAPTTNLRFNYVIELPGD